MKDLQKRLNNIEKFSKKSIPNFLTLDAAEKLFLNITEKEYSPEEKLQIQDVYKKLLKTFDLNGKSCMYIYKKMCKIDFSKQNKNITIASVSSNIPK